MTESKESQDQKHTANLIALSILDSDIKIPPMPESGTKIMAMVQEPIDKIDLGKFCKLIEPDPGLFTRIIQLSNSPFFRGVDEIVSLRTAVIRIGLEEAINAANLYFLQRFLPKIKDIKGFSAQDYWTFSWACAVAGKRLGHPKLTQSTLPGELYIAGLLHGVGKLILSLQYPEIFTECIATSNETGLGIDTVIQEKFGTPDNLIASKLMAAWNIPSKICSAVEYYKSPGTAPENVQEIAGLTQLAYWTASFSKNTAAASEGIERSKDCWISQNHASPLSKEAARHQIILEILTTIDKKSASITNPASAITENEQPEQPAQTPTASAIKKRPPKKEIQFLWLAEILVPVN